jgi:hypothetical protein
MASVMKKRRLLMHVDARKVSTVDGAGANHTQSLVVFYIDKSTVLSAETSERAELTTLAT